MIVDLSVIQQGWYLWSLKDVRTPIRKVGDIPQHVCWLAELQINDGGGRLTSGMGATPQEALDEAVEKVDRFLE